MEDIKSYEQFIETAQNFLIEGDYSSVIVDREKADDIMKYFNKSIVFIVEDCMDEEDEICLITRVGNEVFKEYPFNNNGELLPIESDRTLVLKSCLCDDEIEEIESRVLIVVDDEEDNECDCVDGCCSDCCDEEMVDELIEELTNELLNRLLEEDSCPHCTIAVLLRSVYQTAYEDGILKSSEVLRDIIRE